MNPASRRLFSAAAILAMPLACSPAGEPRNALQGGTQTMVMQLTSKAFTEGQPIPEKHTCDGKDVSPPLKWSGAPERTRSYVLVCEDPDAPSGLWVHWTLFNLPSSTNELPEGVPKSEQLKDGGVQGLNGFDKVGYGGPCPPRGAPHRYFFKVYALDASLDLEPRTTHRVLMNAIKGHVLGEGHLMGTYARK